MPFRLRLPLRKCTEASETIVACLVVLYSLHPKSSWDWLIPGISLTFLSALAKKVLGTSKVSHKYQVTIPKDARDAFKIKAGDRLVFFDEDDELLLERGNSE